MTKLMKVGAIAFAWALQACGPAFAEQLDAKDIKSFISGKHVYLSTPYGVELPLHYKSNGQVAGDVTGISLASMFAPKETGSWWTKGNSLCQRWPSWYDGKTFCFTINKTGPKSLSWVRDDGLKGTARITG